jgi:hypothetical protein
VGSGVLCRTKQTQTLHTKSVTNELLQTLTQMDMRIQNNLANSNTYTAPMNCSCNVFSHIHYLARSNKYKISTPLYKTVVSKI